MKKFYIFILGLLMIFSLNSCETYTYATTQDDIHVETDVDIVQSNIGFDIIVKYGTPYYYNGSILYYLYEGLYYYPYWYENYWYVRAYRHPFKYYSYKPYFRPHRYDYRFKPGIYKGYNRPYYMHHNHQMRPTRPNNHQMRPQRPSNHQMRPQRPSNHQMRPHNRNYGGRR